MARPLTKRKESGELYSRPPSIESNIDGASGQDERVLRRRLQVVLRGEAEYLTSECLVHLIRHFARLKSDAIRDAIVMVILSRCEAILNARIDSRVADAEHLREEVLGEFALILASDGVGECPDELDYYECCFNHAFSTLRIDIFRHEMKRRRRESPLPGEGVNQDDQAVESDDESMSCRPTQDDDLIRGELLDLLPADIRQTVILCHEMGYDAESVNTKKDTAATLSGVSGSTIRARLRRAKALISEMNQEEL